MEFSDHFEKLGQTKIYINCPYCVKRKLDKEFNERADKGQHMLLDSQRNFYYCFRCNVQGKLEDLDSPASVALQVEQFELSTLKSRLKNLKINQVHFKGYRISEIGKPIVTDSEAYNYLIKRRIPGKLIQHYGLLEGLGLYKNRIIIPEYNLKRDRIRYFTARAFNKATPKYLNPPVPKSNIVYNINNVETDHCILCEGCISAISAGRSGIAVYGKKVSFQQYSSISLKFKRVYICLDPDVDLKVRKDIRNNFLMHGCESGIVENLSGDPNDVSESDFLQALENTKIYSPLQLSLVQLQKNFL